MVKKAEWVSDKNKGWSWASQQGLYLSKSWRQLREVILTDEPLCRMCKTMKYITTADMVDHIIPINEHNWKELFLEPTNLQPLCDSCHSFKTQRDKWHGNCSLTMDEIINL